jgi:biotin transport system permease protein
VERALVIGSLYSERPTWLHRWSAGAKMLALSCLSTVLFATSSPQWLLPLAVASAGVYLSLGPIGPAGRRR